MIVVLMGVSGCGKSTIGSILAEDTGFPFFDGDDFHPPENVSKMSSGEPLTDKDRIAWINAICDHLNKLRTPTAFLACSALTSFIRSYFQSRLNRQHHFIFLDGERNLILERMRGRGVHFMKPDMLDSQFAALEDPGPDAIRIAITSSPEEVAKSIRQQLSI